ncbi:hypothetical protein [Undibacterium umbellatum]|uniref:DUF2975 domain-containing protein n=1 Tax=Undibacterium umbellatum TaxID=2762300 RepID=A0ABR6ZCI3_9BURK|nr:hypothetical protein [Undibacterium umbellatum]MBC3909469.1 hypothetical protein [Undibacterium umbellatum]
MQVQKHARIANIRKLSRYFLFLTVLTMVIIAIGGIGFPIFLMTVSSGDLTVAEYLARAAIMDDGYFSLLKEGLSLQLKVVAGLAWVVWSAVIGLVLVHINQLLTCFHEGEIFNKKAIFHARRAFNINLIVVASMVGVDFLSILLSHIYPSNGNTGDVGHFIARIFDHLTWIGFFLLLLWSLEIGVDLNEEAELTI